VASSRPSIAQLLQQGQAHHQQGQWDLAAARYREIIDRQPRSFEALHLLGLLKLQAGDPAGAVLLLKRAAKANPAEAQTQTLIGIALQSTGETATSLDHFQRAIKLAPRNAEYHYNLGKALRLCERLEDAVASYESALKLKPCYPDALNNLSEVQISLERPEKALEASEMALRIHPGHAEALSNKGGALLALDRSQEALECIEAALSINSALPKALNNKAQALVKLRRFDEALACASQAVEMQPGSAEALFARGLVLSEMRRLPEAIADFDKALLAKPNVASYLVSRGSVHFHTLQYEAAIADFEAAIRTGRSNSTVTKTAHSNLGSLLLLNGQFERGWQEFEWRWGTNDFKDARLEFDIPQWDGAPTKGHVLIWREQGLGDQILFASMLEDAAKLAGRVSVALEKRLHALFQRSFANLKIISLEEAQQAVGFDFQVPLGDLGRITRQTVDDCLRSRKAYMRPDSNRANQLRGELRGPDNKKICGISWSSKHKSVGDAKSISLQDLAPVLSSENYHFVDLQYGDTTEERKHLLNNSGIEVHRVASVDNWNDIDGLAALIDACDVIVTISNTTAHLAGALGKKVFLMLPSSVGRFWCWQTERSDALWYPDVRIFRQPKEGDWASVIREVRDALAALPRPDGA